MKTPKTTSPKRTVLFWNPARIKELRTERGLSKAYVSRAIKTHWTTVNRVENGTHASPELIAKLATFHHVPLTDLLLTSATD